MAEILGRIVLSIIGAATATLIAVGVAILFAFPVKWTWNEVMPYLFNLKEVTVGQAWCLVFLAGVLLKSTHVTNTEEK